MRPRTSGQYIASSGELSAHVEVGLDAAQLQRHLEASPMPCQREGPQGWQAPPRPGW